MHHNLGYISYLSIEIHSISINNLIPVVIMRKGKTEQTLDNGMFGFSNHACYLGGDPYRY